MSGLALFPRGREHLSPVLISYSIFKPERNGGTYAIRQTEPEPYVTALRISALPLMIAFLTASGSAYLPTAAKPFSDV